MSWKSNWGNVDAPLGFHHKWLFSCIVTSWISKISNIHITFFEFLCLHSLGLYFFWSLILSDLTHWPTFGLQVTLVVAYQSMFAVIPLESQRRGSITHQPERNWMSMALSYYFCRLQDNRSARKQFSPMYKSAGICKPFLVYKILDLSEGLSYIFGMVSK